VVLVWRDGQSYIRGFLPSMGDISALFGEAFCCRCEWEGKEAKWYVPGGYAASQARVDIIALVEVMIHPLVLNMAQGQRLRTGVWVRPRMLVPRTKRPQEPWKNASRYLQVQFSSASSLSRPIRGFEQYMTQKIQAENLRRAKEMYLEDNIILPDHDHSFFAQLSERVYTNSWMFQPKSRTAYAGPADNIVPIGMIAIPGCICSGTGGNKKKLGV
jgi:hypothetical protein